MRLINWLNKSNENRYTWNVVVLLLSGLIILIDWQFIEKIYWTKFQCLVMYLGFMLAIAPPVLLRRIK